MNDDLLAELRSEARARSSRFSDLALFAADEIERLSVAAGILQKLFSAAVIDYFDDMTLVATVINGEQVWFDLSIEEMAYLAGVAAAVESSDRNPQ